ncbi:hypothetical protein D3C80_1736250 [compost metagenome]
MDTAGLFISQARDKAVGEVPMSAAILLTSFPSAIRSGVRKRLKFGSVSARDPAGAALLLYLPVSIPPASGK